MTEAWTYFVAMLTVLAVIGLLLVWALRKDPRSGRERDHTGTLEIPGGHVTYMPQIRQALEKDDLLFLESRGAKTIAQNLRRERTRVLLLYLDAMRHDFQKLLRLAQVIASLSPEIAPAREGERLLLSLRFSANCFLVRTRLKLGMSALPQLSGLSHSVSELTVRIEAAMLELGERAALASEMASASHP